jgi:hypothetical protein
MAYVIEANEVEPGAGGSDGNVHEAVVHTLVLIHRACALVAMVVAIQRQVHLQPPPRTCSSRASRAFTSQPSHSDKGGAHTGIWSRGLPLCLISAATHTSMRT